VLQRREARRFARVEAPRVVVPRLEAVDERQGFVHQLRFVVRLGRIDERFEVLVRKPIFEALVRVRAKIADHQAQQRFGGFAAILIVLVCRAHVLDRLVGAAAFTMLAALLEQCGAAAAVQIGDLEVWREAVRVVGRQRRQALAAASGPVMGRILESMPFNDDPRAGRNCREASAGSQTRLDRLNLKCS
jgi:hypothetical protein